LVSRVDRTAPVSTFQCNPCWQDHACRMRVFDTANSIGHPSCARAIFAGSSRSWLDQCADRLSPVTTPARWRRVSVAAVRASIAAARRERHRLRDISRQIRTPQRSSHDEDCSSFRPLKHGRDPFTAFWEASERSAATAQQRRLRGRPKRSSA